MRGAMLGSLMADGLCLGSHYEYDAPTIKKAYGGKSTRAAKLSQQGRVGLACTFIKIFR